MELTLNRYTDHAEILRSRWGILRTAFGKQWPGQVKAGAITPSVEHPPTASSAIPSSQQLGVVRLTGIGILCATYVET